MPGWIRELSGNSIGRIKGRTRAMMKWLLQPQVPGRCRIRPFRDTEMGIMMRLMRVFTFSYQNFFDRSLLCAAESILISSIWNLAVPTHFRWKPPAIHLSGKFLLLRHLRFTVDRYLPVAGVGALGAIHLPSLANVGSLIGPANRCLRALSIVQIADFDAFSSEVRCRPSKRVQFGHTGFCQ